MNKCENYNFINILRQAYSHLSLRLQKVFWILLMGMIFMALIETLTAGSVAIFLSAVTNPEAVFQSAHIERIQQLIGIHFISSPLRLILFLSIMTVGIMALQVITRTFVTFYTFLYANYIGTYLGDILLSRILHGPYQWIISKNSADLIQALSWRVHAGLFFKGILRALSDIIIVVVMISALFIVQPVVSIPIALIIGVISFLIFTQLRKRLDRISTRLKDYRRYVNRLVHKSIIGVKDIKVYHREHLFKRDYNNLAYVEARLGASQQILAQCTSWFIELAGLFLLSATVCIMFFFTNATSLKTTGTITLLAASAWRILPAISRITQGLSQLRISIPYVTVILKYLSEIEPSVGSEAEKIISNRKHFKFENKAVFNKVSFAYKGYENYVLNDLTFQIQRGETVGIVGVSGTGKSTLVDLFIGLLAPTSGKIVIDGHDLEDPVNKSNWMLNIGYVPQSPYICVGTVAENVAFGYSNREIDRQQVMKCCNMAAMDDFLWDLPENIDTQIGERGVKLSGGQKQRVAIARALYHSPAVMIFDEATSSLDTKSEKAIQKTIYSLKGKQTLIIIAHRLSTVEQCDKVIWLEQGKVKKIGFPDVILLEYRLLMTEKK